MWFNTERETLKQQPPSANFCRVSISIVSIFWLAVAYKFVCTATFTEEREYVDVCDQTAANQLNFQRDLSGIDVNYAEITWGDWVNEMCETRELARYMYNVLMSFN